MSTCACYGLTLHTDSEDNVEEQDRPGPAFISLPGQMASGGWVTSNWWRQVLHTLARQLSLTNSGETISCNIAELLYILTCQGTLHDVSTEYKFKHTHVWHITTLAHADQGTTPLAKSGLNRKSEALHKPVLTDWGRGRRSGTVTGRPLMLKSATARGMS